MEIVIILLLLVVAALLVLVLLAQRKSAEDNARAARQGASEAVGELSAGLTAGVAHMGRSISENVRTLGESVNARISVMKDSLTESQNASARHQAERLAAMNENMGQRLQSLERRISSLEQLNETKLESQRQMLQSSMQELRQENAKKLDEIRGTVDEKLQDTLQKRISESFETVSRQLEQVYKGLGEMQHLAADVGGLKQVLSGVKTRGILGEIQLGAILEEILTPEQYDTNAATIPGSRERVEFAVKLPGSDGGHVYLPIDSKFPGDTYMHYQDAQLSGDPAALEEAQRNLTAVLKKCARDIREKYVEPPYTTTFGILFLPFEGLYADVVNQGLIEVLQREYSVNVAGPSTMAALLNSLQMGFRTLAIQRRSSEVWQVLGEVKTEFGKFEESMKKMQTHLRQTSDDLEHLMGTRTRAINRRLRSVQQLEPYEEPAEPNLLGTEDS